MAMVSTPVLEAIRELVDLTHGSFMDLIFMDLIRDPFIAVPAFIRDHFNRAYWKVMTACLSARLVSTWALAGLAQAA